MSKSKTPLEEYRNNLLALEQKMQSEYDKAVMTLSGGALGVSLSFLSDVVLKQGVFGGKWLLAAWFCWGLSVTCALYSFLTSVYALRKTLQQLDDDILHREPPGGAADKATKCLNVIAGLLFLAGVVAMILFVALNIT